MLTLLWPLEMKNFPIGKQIQEIAGASFYQHLLPGSQEHWGLSFLNLTYQNNKEFNCERRIKSSPEKSPFFSHSNFWTWPSQQKCPALTPYHSWCTITLNTDASSILMDVYLVITSFSFCPGTRRNFAGLGTLLYLYLSTAYLSTDYHSTMQGCIAKLHASTLRSGFLTSPPLSTFQPPTLFLVLGAQSTQPMAVYSVHFFVPWMHVLGLQ